MDRSSAAPTGRDRERAERLTKDWIARLIERTPLAEVGGLPLARIAAEAPPLISTAFVALGSGERGPGELAEAAVRLAELFGEAAAPVTAERPVAEAATRAPARPQDDPITGLSGPDSLADRLGTLLAEQRRYGHPFSLAVVDVDGLARVNEAYGRAAGDRVLAGVAAVLRRQLRDADEAFRVEDDEFAVLAPHTDAAHLVPLATRLANLIAGAQRPGDPRIAVTVGVVGCPDDGLGPERLLESATEAIYAAKAAGAAVARSPNGADGVLQDP